MNIKHIAAVALLASAASMASATTTADLGSYTVTYDETTLGFGFLAGNYTAGGNEVGFNWNVSDDLLATWVGSGSGQQVFSLPSFTITAKPGWNLSGPVTGFLGNLAFTEVFGGSVAVSASADVAVNGLPVGSVSGSLTRTVTAGAPGVFSQGYFSASTSATFPFSSLSVSNASLTVDLGGTSASSFASLQGQPQNQLRVSLFATPVPEPETYAMMLAGLAAMGFMARRRRG